MSKVAQNHTILMNITNNCFLRCPHFVVVRIPAHMRANSRIHVYAHGPAMINALLNSLLSPGHVFWLDAKMSLIWNSFYLTGIIRRRFSHLLFLPNCINFPGRRENLI